MKILDYRAFSKHEEFLDKLSIMESLLENVKQDDPNNLMREEVKNDIKRCVGVILGKYPFFGEYLIDCRFLYDHPKIETMATDGKNIFINSRFAAGLSDDEMIFILCHEVLHIMLLHHLRMANKFGGSMTQAEAEKWNYAADLELNPMLVADGLLTREQVKNDIEGLYEDEYIGVSAEVIYDKLKDDASQQPPPSSQSVPVNVGSVIYTKDKKFGKITKINVDGSYEADEITQAEAEAILAK